MFEGQAMLSGGKLAIYAVVSVAALVFGMFRLDEVIARKKRARTRRVRRPMGHDAEGDTLFTDPDGRAWREPKK